MKNLKFHNHSIWRYAQYYENPPLDENQITLQEGWTKEIEIKELSQKLDIENLIFKREDLNPNGSHKDRALAFQIAKYKELGEKRVLISTSGNAGVSAAAYGKLAGLDVYVFASPKTRQSKLEQIRKFGAKLILTNHAINFSKKVSRQYQIPNLRPSTDDLSIEGFKSIGFEIYEKVGDVDSIFVFVSSGSSFVGISRAYDFLQKDLNIPKVPKMHVVQTGLVSSVAASGGDLSSTRSIVGDLGVKKTRRKREILHWIKETGGSSWLVSDEEILQAIHLLNSYGIDSSVESAANFAGVIQAAKHEKLGKVICLLTGHGSQWKDRNANIPSKKVIDDYNQVSKIFD